MTNKLRSCKKCQQDLTEKNSRFVRKTGALRGTCTVCYRKQRREYNERFYSDPNNLEHKKRQERTRYWAEPERRELRLSYTRQWKESRPKLREEYKLKTYGLTIEQFEQMLEAQEGRCAICGEFPYEELNGKTKKLAVDHDHITGKVRALLCSGCNGGLGLFRDNIETLNNAISYLLKHRRAP
jgi:hypothetical protein